MKIAVDVMGTDYGPAEIIKGVLQAVKEYGCDAVLVGDEDVIKAELRREHEENNPHVTIHHASEVIEMKDHPGISVKKKRDASIVVATDLLRQKECDALVIGTPVYWGNISGQMKLMFDRIVPAMMGESKLGIPIALHKGKKAVIVTACTTIWPFSWIARQTSNANHAMKEILGYSGFKIVGKLVLPGTKKKNGVTQKIINKAKRLALKLNK